MRLLPLMARHGGGRCLGSLCPCAVRSSAALKQIHTFIRSSSSSNTTSASPVSSLRSLPNIPPCDILLAVQEGFQIMMERIGILSLPVDLVWGAAAIAGCQVAIIVWGCVV